MNLAQRLPEFTLGEVDYRISPFRYFLARNCVGAEMASALLGWFETDAPWRLVSTDFYQQYEFSMLDVVLPDQVSRVILPEKFADLRQEMEGIFGVELDVPVSLVAHKLVAGQHIAIHNDHLFGGESHRLTVHLNRGLLDQDGGFFMLFNSFDARDIHTIIRPVTGSAIGFEIGENSHHAVSRLHAGERYTLVYSFFIPGYG